MKVVIGLGLTSNATALEVCAALSTTVEVAGCSWPDVVEIATLDSKRDHPALEHLSIPLRFLSAPVLAQVSVPHSSVAAAKAHGTASVAEAAALVAAGASALLVPKSCTPSVCTAVAVLNDSR